MTPQRPAIALALLATLAALGPGAPAAAQEAAETDAAHRFGAELHLQGLWFENFFQAPEGADREDVAATEATARLAARPWSGRPLELYGTLGATRFSDELGTSPALGLGARWLGRPLDADLRLLLQRDRPVVDVGDTPGEADVASAAGEVGLRATPDWQLTALGEVQRQDFARDDGRDNDFASLGGAVRYRGWGSVFSPELGLERGERDADDPDEDHEQTDLWLKLRSAPHRDLYLSLRYRRRDREYPVGDPGAGNFGREDDRRQWSLVADWTVATPWTLTLYWAHEDADSTKASRTFTAQTVALGVRYRL